MPRDACRTDWRSWPSPPPWCRPAIVRHSSPSWSKHAAWHLRFTSNSMYAADAANRAVMADTDDASTAAANEARQARQAVERHVETLRPMLASLGFDDDLKHLDGFTSRFDEYRKLDDEIFSLAIQNTNLKAQRLSFGPAQEAAVAFRSSVDAAVRSSTAKDCCDATSIGARANTALLDVQVMQAPHIAEADDAVMTRLEGQMTAAAAVAGKAVDELGRTPSARRRGLSSTRRAPRSRASWRFTSRSSRCPAATPTFARSRCRSAENGCSRRRVRSCCRPLKPRSLDMRSTPRASAPRRAASLALPGRQRHEHELLHVLIRAASSSAAVPSKWMRPSCSTMNRTSAALAASASSIRSSLPSTRASCVAM